jgi:copper chaperone CopZ
METLRALRNSTVFTSLLLITALASCQTAATSTAEAGDGARYTLGIEGMSCATNCAPKVKSSLESIDGVESVEVSFENKQAIVTMAPGRELTQEACDKSFGNAGYYVSSIAPAAPPATP